jgi:hypothetical protein
MTSPSRHAFWSPSKDSFTNPNFVDITGWTVVLQQVKLGITQIGGFTTPVDTQLPPRPVGDNTVATGTYNALLDPTELPPGFGPPSKSLRLYNDGSENLAYGIVHGPYVISEETVNLIPGSTCEFWWRAFGSADAYDVYGYLLNVANGSTITLLNETGADDNGQTAWAKNTTQIPANASGTYKFVFIGGSYDFTGGRVYGASLFITGVRVVAPVAPPQ